MQNESDKKIGYVEAFKKAFIRIWRYKFLWFWGIFLPSAFSFNINFPGSPNETRYENLSASQMQEKALGFLEENWKLIALGAAVFLLLSLILWIISAIARGGVISFLNFSQNLKDDYKKISPKEEFKGVWTMGKNKLKKILKLDLLFYLASLAIFFVAMLPIAASIMNGKKGLVFVIIAGLLVLLPLLFLFILIKNISLIYIVLANLKTFQAVEQSYYLIIKNIKELIKLLACFLLLGFLASFALAAVAMVLAVIFIGFLGLLTISLGINLKQLFQFSPEIFSQGMAPTWELIIILSFLLMFLLLFLLLILAAKSILALIKYDVWIWWVKKNQAIKIRNEALIKNPALKKERPSAAVESE